MELILCAKSRLSCLDNSPGPSIGTVRWHGDTPSQARHMSAENLASGIPPFVCSISVPTAQLRQ